MKLDMDSNTIRAQIDMCGKMTAYCAENAYKVVDDDVMYSLNQATIALQDAYRRLSAEAK